MKNIKPTLSCGARLLWIMCRMIAILPHWFRYNCLGKLIYVVLRYLVRYRRKLILKQLADSFPEKSEAEIETICNDFYKNLAEIFINTISLAGITEHQRRESVRFIIDDSVREALKDRHFVVLASHWGFWEYAQYIDLAMPGCCEVGAYHPLSSKVWDELFIYLRTFENVIPIPSQKYLRYVIEHKAKGVDGKYMILGMASDQNAPPKGDVHWYNFLNRPTLFFEGGEQLALRFGMPVVYFRMRYLSPGRYECDVELLYDGESQAEKHSITEKYVRLLEDDIRHNPAQWMWSHRRWKYYPDPVTGEAIYRRTGV